MANWLHSICDSGNQITSTMEAVSCLNQEFLQNDP